jgi:hypothetical protein
MTFLDTLDEMKTAIAEYESNELSRVALLYRLHDLLEELKKK